MRPRHPLIWALLVLSGALAWCTTQANAIPIHRHLEVLRYSTVEPARTVQHVVRVEHVAPPYVPPAPTTSADTGATTGAVPYVGSTPPEYIKQCESGGDYGAVNASSGAYGAWQILPSTSAAYGCDMSSPAGQDACAAEIYGDVGSSAWVCAG